MAPGGEKMSEIQENKIKINVQETQEAPYLLEGADSCLSSPAKVYFNKLKQLAEWYDGNARYILYFFEKNGEQGIVVQRIKVVTYDVGMCSKSTHYDLAYHYFGK